MPKVSIVLPVHNAQATLEECLRSIEHQSFDRFELVVVDDASTDASWSLIGGWAAKDPRVRGIQLGRLGLVGALNLGVRESRGEYVARMDADDRMHPDRLRLQVEYLESHPDTALVGSTVQLFSDGRIRAGYREYVSWQNGVITAADIASEIYVESPFAHPTVMVRRRVFDAVGGYRHGPFPEDYDLWLRLQAGGFRMAKLRRSLLEWRDRPDRASRNDSRYSRDAFDRLRAEYLVRDPRVVRPSEVVFWGAGRRTRQRARHVIDRGLTPFRWIDIDPRKIGRLAGGIRVESPEWLVSAGSRPFVLIYIARHGARDAVSAFLENAGFIKGADYLAVG